MGVARPTEAEEFKDPVPDPRLVATGPETVAQLVRESGRLEGTPIRRTFVQPVDRAKRKNGGPLAKLVRRRDQRALVLYLLVLTLASKGPEWTVWRETRRWVRALDLSDTRYGREAVSRTWSRLRDIKLLTTHRAGGKSIVTVLKEDGSGDPYSYPEPDVPEDRYLRLPLAFWLDGWYQQLSLPAMAMLLVLLAEKDDVVLPIDRIPEWYGLSRATAQRGLVELRTRGLLNMWVVQRPEPRSPEGYTFDRHHRLLGAFAKPSRKQTTATVTELKPSAAKRRRRRRKEAASDAPGKKEAR